MQISLFLKEHDIDILALNKTWLKSKSNLDILNYTMSRNDRPKRKEGDAAIFLHNDINFRVADTCSSIDTDNKAIKIILKDAQISSSISTIYIPSASLINTLLLRNIKNSSDNVIITRDLNAKRT